MSYESKCLGLSWATALGPIFETLSMQELKMFLKLELRQGHTIYPRLSHIFRAFQLTPLNRVRIVFVGQDPYHGPNQAEGLCFSVSPGVPIPPSLRNIYQELQSDLKIAPPQTGSLVHWAEQGCFMINTRLTVRAGLPLSHNHPGWDFFITQVFQALDSQSHPILFVLLGQSAQKLQLQLHNPIHEYIQAPHPSPLSAYRGFLGSKLFSQMNAFLKKHHYSRIDWA